jgi:hypothetical protein
MPFRNGTPVKSLRPPCGADSRPGAARHLVAQPGRTLGGDDPLSSHPANPEAVGTPRHVVARGLRPNHGCAGSLGEG